MRKQKAWEYINELQRESIMQRFDSLHKVCAPKLKKQKLPTAWIDRMQLESFDQLRHQVIHGRRFLRKVPDIENQIHFAKLTGFSTLTLVGEAYGLLSDKELFPRKSSFLRLLAVANQEFPEFVEFIETIAEEKDLKNESHP